jgi:O-antigen/teichoic acid export membrane protein
MIPKDKLLANIVSVVATRILLKSINFISLYVLLRYLSPEKFGEYGLLISTLVLSTTLGNLGLRNASAREIGAKNNSGNVITFLAVAYPFVMLSSVCVMLGTLFLNNFPLSVMKDLFWIILLVGCHLIIILRQGVCLGEGDIRLFNLLDVMPRLGLLVVIVFVTELLDGIHKEVTIYGLVLGYGFTAYYALFRTRIEFRLPHREQFLLFKTGLVFCLALTLILLNSRVPLYLGNLLQGTFESGQIFAALRFNDVFLEVASAAGLVLFSHASRLQAERNVKTIYNSIIGVLLVTIAIAFVLYFYAADVVILIAGEKYMGTADYLPIVAIGLPFAAFNKMAYGLISGRGNPSYGVIVYSLVIPVNVILAVALFQEGVNGYSLYALVVSQLLAAILFFIVIVKMNKSMGGTVL